MDKDKLFGRIRPFAEGAVENLESFKEYLPKEWTPRQLTTLSMLSAIYSLGLNAEAQTPEDQVAYSNLEYMNHVLIDQFPDYLTASAVVRLAKDNARELVNNLQEYKEIMASIAKTSE